MNQLGQAHDINPSILLNDTRDKKQLRIDEVNLCLPYSFLIR